MKSVIRSIKPYWVFLIIARKIGWNIPQEKTVEVGKNQPLAKNWNRKTLIYCSKDKKSFNRIPEEYQSLMRPFLGKVIGEFICDKIDEYPYGKFGYEISEESFNATMLTAEEFCSYGKQKPLYGWNISDLKIYDKPKEINEFKKAGFMTEEEWLFNLYPNTHCHYEAWAKKFNIDRPPQSWCYVEVEQ